MSETVRRPYVGQRLPRKEDLALVTGTARFLEDLRLPGMLYAKILRSEVARARIKNIDTSKAKTMPGVHGVLTGADLVGKVTTWGHQFQGLTVGSRFPFAVDDVNYFGHGLASVVASSKYQALDALEAIKVDLEPLRPVLDPEDAMDPDAPLVREDVAYELGQGNIYSHFRCRVGDISEAEKSADTVITRRISMGRVHGMALESHGCIADYDSTSGKLTIYSSTQSVFLLRDVLAEILKLPISRVRAVALEVGAGFGSKADIFEHEVIASIFAMQLGRPVHLVLSRTEIFTSTTARCNQVRYASLYVKKSGEIVGYRDDIVHNVGAATMWGNQVVQLGTHIGLASYKIPNVHIDEHVVHTNTAMGGALRGFGVPQQVWAQETLVDEAAFAIGMDPIEMRLRNVVTDDQCPFTTPMGHVIDSTSMHESLIRVAKEIQWDARKKIKAPYEGLGVAMTAKHSSARHPSADTDLSSMRIRIETDGTVTAFSSDVPHGQGHETMLAQIIADSLGVKFTDIRLLSSDTDRSNYGLGTWGARSAVVLGAAAQMASERVLEKLKELAGHFLEASSDDIEVSEGNAYVRGTPSRSMAVAELAVMSSLVTHSLPPGFEPGSLEAVATYDTPTTLFNEQGGNITITYSSGVHAAYVRVHPDTGRVEILDYAMVHDSGVVINPMIVEGQYHGGFLHGYGIVFGEDLVYDEDGKMLNASFENYYIPYASDMPDLGNMHSLPAPSRVVPGGRKGAGETATPPVAPAIANAIFDATGIRFLSLPITPEHMLMALREKERQGVDTFDYPYDMPGYNGRREFTRPNYKPQEMVAK